MDVIIKQMQYIDKKNINTPKINKSKFFIKQDDFKNSEE